MGKKLRVRASYLEIWTGDSLPAADNSVPTGSWRRRSHLWFSGCLLATTANRWLYTSTIDRYNAFRRLKRPMSSTHSLPVRTRWIRASQTTEVEPVSGGVQTAAVAAVDVPRCSSPRPVGALDHFRSLMTVPPTSPTMIASSKKR